MIFLQDFYRMNLLCPLGGVILFKKRQRVIFMKYAHSLPDTPVSQWQSLEDHLKNVAELAGTFASDFSSSSIAELLGPCS